MILRDFTLKATQLLGPTSAVSLLLKAELSSMLILTEKCPSSARDPAILQARRLVYVVTAEPVTYTGSYFAPATFCYQEASVKSH